MANKRLTQPDTQKAFNGDRGDNVVRGGDTDDLIFGHGGDDKLFGAAGNDELRGGVGNDRLVDGEGDDVLLGSRGDDTFVIITGVDTTRGGDGDDSVILDGNFADWQVDIVDHKTFVFTRGDQIVTTNTVEVAQFDDRAVWLEVPGPL